MTTLKNETEYNAIMQHIEELITSTDDDTPRYDKNMIEFDILTELTEEYEDIHFPIG